MKYGKNLWYKRKIHKGSVPTLKACYNKGSFMDFCVYQNGYALPCVIEYDYEEKNDNRVGS